MIPARLSNVDNARGPFGQKIRLDLNCAAEQLECEFTPNNWSLYHHQTAVYAVRNNLGTYFYGLGGTQGSIKSLL